MLGIVSKYQRTAIGGLISVAIFGELRTLPDRYPIDWVAAGWVLEQNTAARRPLEAIGFRPAIKYNLYEKMLAPQSTSDEPAAQPERTERDRVSGRTQS